MYTNYTISYWVWCMRSCSVGACCSAYRDVVFGISVVGVGVGRIGVGVGMVGVWAGVVCVFKGEEGGQEKTDDTESIQVKKGRACQHKGSLRGTRLWPAFVC